MSKDKKVKVHQLNQNGNRQQKRTTRIEQLEKAVRQMSSLPQFLLKKFQDLAKVVEDVRFTYEIIGIVLKEKGIISQEELNVVGKRLIEERKKERKEDIGTMHEEGKARANEAREPLGAPLEGKVVGTLSKEEAEKELSDSGDGETRSEIAKKLMQPREDLKKDQIQDVDVSVKKIEEPNEGQSK